MCPSLEQIAAGGALGRLAVLALAALLAGCTSEVGGPEGPTAPTPSSPTPEAADPSRPTEEGDALEAAVGLTFGLPLPAGLELIERDEDVARFGSPHPLAALLSFYDRELTDHTRSDGPDGTKYEPDADDETTVFVVRGEDEVGATARVELIYVRGPADLSALALGDDEADEAADEEPARERSRWGQLPPMPPQVYERLVAERRFLRTGGGRFYEERFEDVDGERARVLVLRGQANDSLLEGQEAPSAAWPERWSRLPRSRGGAFDRGDGQLSLRPAPERDAEGNALPFYGSRPIGVDLDELERH